MGQTTEDLKSQIAEQRESLGQDLEAIGDRVSPSRMAQRRKAAVRERWDSTKQRVMGTTGDTTAKASSMVSGVGNTVSSLPRNAAQVAEGNPLAVGLVAFGTGLVLATLLPETRPEQQLAEKVQPMVENAASEIGGAAQEAVEQLKPKTQEAIEQVKSSAMDSAAQVKEQASDAASQASEQAKQSATSSGNGPSRTV
jgi:gas vesicle protein